MSRAAALRLGLLAALALAACLPAAAVDRLMPVTISVPGPRSLSYLPFDLMPHLGADRAEGLDVRLRFTGSGAVALENMQQRVTDFAAAGVPAMMSHRLRGGEVTVLAAANDQPLFVLMVRSDLRGKVKAVADLRGRVVGVNSSSLTSKTTSQQLLELLLAEAGVPADAVRVVPGGQSWQSHIAILAPDGADAMLGDEPFASRLLAAGKVFFLFNLGEADAGSRRFLHAALGTRPDVVTRHPDLARRLVAALRRTLQWIAAHPPEDVVAALGVPDAGERAALLAALRKYPRLYSADGRLSARQLKDTEEFFRRTEGDAVAPRLTIDTMVTDKWAGRSE